MTEKRKPGRPRGVAKVLIPHTYILPETMAWLEQQTKLYRFSFGELVDRMVEKLKKID